MEFRDKNGLTEKEFLQNYHAGDYERPSVTVDMIMFTVADLQEKNYRKLPEKQLQILLIKRGGHPFLHKWALPGGFVHPNEDTEQAALRELEEETGVKNVYLEQVHTFSKPHRDPRTWVISTAYMALIDSGKIQLQAGDDATDAKWFTVSYQPVKEEKEIGENILIKSSFYKLVLICEDIHLSSTIQHKVTSTNQFTKQEYFILDNEGLAFDHAEIIAHGVQQLRKKIESTNLALYLMPPLFTLTQLQQVYEVILDKELLKASFRRKIAHRVVKTDEYLEDMGHRPSRLYKRNKEEDFLL